MLEGLRSELQEHRDRLRKEIADQGVDPDSEDFHVDLERGFADSAHSTAERARLIALVKELRSNLLDIGRALDKMERGTFGRCERCHQPIPPERLEAIPWARLCISCKQKAL
jgi:RNA polymerase-binding transcription factor DksA